MKMIREGLNGLPITDPNAQLPEQLFKQTFSLPVAFKIRGMIFLICRKKPS